MTWRRFHLGAMVAWLTVGGFITWRHADSVAWVAFMSLYANFVSHWGAYQGARAEDVAKDE